MYFTDQPIQHKIFYEYKISFKQCIGKQITSLSQEIIVLACFLFQFYQCQKFFSSKMMVEFYLTSIPYIKGLIRPDKVDFLKTDMFSLSLSLFLIKMRKSVGLKKDVVYVFWINYIRLTCELEVC